MKKILLVFIFLLLLTGCGSNIYDYNVEDWKSSNKQDTIVKEIMNIWEDNNEVYSVNMKVDQSSVKGHINLYINENPNTEKSIFEIACEIVGVDYNKYKK